ncbi:tetratricopeptide repeat-containing sensor histidine kinase [Ekhidna sp.]
MLTRLYLFFTLLGVLATSTYSQYSPDETSRAISSMSEEEQIEYVNSNFYSIYSANFSNSLKLTKNVVELSNRLKLPAKEALAQKNRGIILYLTGDYEQAIKAYLRSYDLYDSLNDKSGLAQLSNEMANYYKQQEDFDRAIEFWEQAEKLASEAGDLRTLGTSYGMQATFYWTRKDYEKSDLLYTKCHSIRIQQNDSVGLGYTFLNLADMERRKGNLDQALEYFNQSTRIRIAIQDKQGVLENYKSIADFHFQNKSYDQAIQFYRKSIKESKTFGYPDLVRITLDSLSSLYAEIGDYKRSLFLKIDAENLEDSLFNLERSRVISELETKYETEKKEQQIVIQNAEIAEQEAEIQRNQILILTSIGLILLVIWVAKIQKSKLKKEQLLKLQAAEIQRRQAEINAAISSQEKERSRYARDLHDGFGQMISILNLNLKSLKKGSKPDDRLEVFESSSKVIDEMYTELKNICFDLMPQTLIKHGLESALTEFVDRVNQAGKVYLELNTFGLEARLLEIQEISLYRISQEWINNILKYSDADRVTLQITKDANEITLLIEDNGSGFDKSLLTSGKGNGWKNLNTRSNLIQGELELETQNGIKGTSLIINAPTEITPTKESNENTVKMV